jgi:hypothetical protein
MLNRDGELKTRECVWDALTNFPETFPKNTAEIIHDQINFLPYLFKLTNQLGDTKNARVPQLPKGHQLCYFAKPHSIWYIDFRQTSNNIYSDLKDRYTFLKGGNNGKKGTLRTLFSDTIQYHAFTTLMPELDHTQIKKENENITPETNSASSTTTTTTTTKPAPIMANRLFTRTNNPINDEFAHVSSLRKSKKS